MSAILQLSIVHALSIVRKDVNYIVDNVLYVLSSVVERVLTKTTEELLDKAL